MTARRLWTALLLDQLEFYWSAHLWPRLQGLTDREYLWEPVPGCWTVRQGPDGRFVADAAFPEPYPPPVTTIAWRLQHLSVGCFASRASTFFGDGTVGDRLDMFDPRHRPESLAATADAALAYLADSYARWHDGLGRLDDDALMSPLGPRGGHFAAEPMAALVLHINRETMHHGGEIGLLRDLYRASTATAGSPSGEQRRDGAVRLADQARDRQHSGDHRGAGPYDERRVGQ